MLDEIIAKISEANALAEKAMKGIKNLPKNTGGHPGAAYNCRCVAIPWRRS